MKNQDVVLVKDKQWKNLEGYLCRASDLVLLTINDKGDEGNLTKMSSISDLKLPLGSIEIETLRAQKGTSITGYISKEKDFSTIYSAFRKSGLSTDEEVLFYWTSYHSKKRSKNNKSPNLVVMICKKDTYNFMGGLRWKKKAELKECIDVLKPRRVLTATTLSTEHPKKKRLSKLRELSRLGKLTYLIILAGLLVNLWSVYLSAYSSAGLYDSQVVAGLGESAGYLVASLVLIVLPAYSIARFLISSSSKLRKVIGLILASLLLSIIIIRTSSNFSQVCDNRTCSSQTEIDESRTSFIGGEGDVESKKCVFDAMSYVFGDDWLIQKYYLNRSGWNQQERNIMKYHCDITIEGSQ